jgi:hypothetical protein
MKIQKWIACVQDRGKWVEVVEKGKTFNQRKFSAWKEEEEEGEEEEYAWNRY